MCQFVGKENVLETSELENKFIEPSNISDQEFLAKFSQDNPESPQELSVTNAQ